MYPLTAVVQESWFDADKTSGFIAVLLFGLLFGIIIYIGRRKKGLYVRPLPVLDEFRDAVGRSVEMARPVLYCPGLSDVSHPATVASFSLMSSVAERAARIGGRLKVPVYSPLVWPVAQNVVRESYAKVGREAEFVPDDVNYLTSRWLTYAMAVAATMAREKTGTNFLLGHFYSEALILAETGASTGALQIGGTDAEAQIPFFITTCDHVLIGEELFAAATLVDDNIVGHATIRLHDVFKIGAIATILVGLGLALASWFGAESAEQLLQSMVSILNGSFDR